MKIAPVRLDFVPIEKISFDRAYQRPLDLSRVKAIANKLKSGASKAVSLSLRPDGSLFCYDGQHTVCAYEMAKVKTVPAVIVEGCQKDEAMWFLEIQKSAKRVFIKDAQRAGIVSGDETAIVAQSFLTKYGLEISSGGTVAHKTGAIGAIRRFAKSDPEVLTKAMDAIKSLWDDYCEAWCAVIIRGMFEVAKDGRINDVCATAKRKKVTPRRILDVAAAMQSSNGKDGSGASYAKRAIIDLCGL